MEKDTFDLEERTRKFAVSIRNFVPQLQKTVGNIEDGKQLLHSSGSVGANYIEANESLSRKDFVHRLRICRKEAKESRYWLGLVSVHISTLENERNVLLNESLELLKIFNAIIKKIEGKKDEK
jgi:four helix bundle protein